MSRALLEAIDSMAGRRVLVVGEAMLDTYLIGSSTRLSREAPVPVVAVDDRIDAAGGAANSAANLRALGARVEFLSVIGTDDEADRLRAALRQARVPDHDVLSAPDRRTLAKQRVLAGDQMLVRFDSGTTGPLPAAIEDEFISRLRDAIPDVDAVVVSDYGYGIFGGRVSAALRQGLEADPKVVVVDARDPAVHKRLAPTAVKPNYAEAVRLLGEQELADPEARARQIVAGRQVLHERTGARVVAVTLDQSGAVILEQGREPYRTYARPRGNERACGAGDTYASTLALALSANAPVPIAAELAAASAGVVVGRSGTAVCSVADLAAAVGRTSKRIDSAAALRERIAFLRTQGQRIVFTNGCFDLLHRGHVSYLNRAKALGDVLIVGVNGDDSVRRLKGPDRPLNALDDRLGVLEALSCIDHVIAFDEPTPEALIDIVRPDVFVKGGDYTLERLPEVPQVERLGGHVRILPYVDDHSTTGLIERMREPAGAVQRPPTTAHVGDGR
ncbi:MAG: D-glycero-beta-D-manno-heptose 1-phosphate adenylyltransferase [Chloroflexota bacterium]